MSHRVELQPSGRRFETEGQESLLHAGLRQGLNLEHGCANGSCGACRARCLSGQLEPIRHHDFPLSPLERAAGVFLMCCVRPRSDLVVEAHETGSAAEIPEQHLRARVSRVQRLGEGVALLEVRTPRAQGLRFLAGQSVRLGFDGMRPRELPIASCPCDGIHLRFHLPRVPGDPFSDLVFERLRRGRELVLSGPCGDFVLDESSRRPLLMIAGEAGFAPLQSLIDHLVQLEHERPVHLYWLSARPGGHYLGNYCRAWEDALDCFHYHPVHLDGVSPDVLRGALGGVLRGHRPLDAWDAYLALPAPWGEVAGALLAGLGMPPGQYRLARLAEP